MQDASQMIGPWLLATLVFLVLLGSGRTLRHRWLGHPPFGGGVALSVAIGVMLFSLLWMGLGHWGYLRSPLPAVILGLGVLLALPGLVWTWNDRRDVPSGLERGFGPRWFAGGAWFLLLVAVLMSFVWISGVLSYGGLGFAFERAGLDWAVGRVVFDPGMPRDPFLGDEPLDLWLYGLSPLASLALSWWLGVAVLFGVCGLGWRLHAHGAGLAAAALMAIVLFASDQPLFLAPALPAAVALMAVMILAVEGRGHPHLGRSLAAGALGGFALISDLGAATMLLPLLLFGPVWCKLEGRNGGRHDAVSGNGGGHDEDADREERVAELEATGAREEDDYGGAFDEGEAAKVGAKKWLVPARHTVYGAVGFTLVAVPWGLRNHDWTDDFGYGLEPGFRIESDLRFRNFTGDALRYEPSFRITDSHEIEPREGSMLGRQYFQYEPLYVDYEPPFGLDFLDDWDFFDGYLDATELGLGVGLLALFAPLYGWRRRDPFYYVAPAALGYAGSYYLGDGEAVTPSSLGLLSVLAGSSLYTMRGCGPTGRQVAFGGTLATGGLALGLTGANDCGYWDGWNAYGHFPQLEFRYDPGDEEAPEEEDRDADWGLDLGYRYGNDWKLEARLEYKWPQAESGRTFDDPGEDDWRTGAGLKYDYELRKGFQLGYRYDWGSLDDEDDATPLVPRIEFRAPGYGMPDEEEDDDDAVEDDIPVQPRLEFSEPGPTVPPPPGESNVPQNAPAERPRTPTYKPDIRPDTGRNIPKQPGYPTQKPRY